jgi:acylphosphatase
MSGRITERMIYSGRVQGVGFRYTVRSLAARHHLTGFVRNLPDTTVELIAQGRQEDISALLADVASHFGRNIGDCCRSPVEGAEAFESFDIRF